ncbi:MAG: GNAT family N-acetyltransferase [bacterium]|nr:GNAT family N-acetyltransferase [bacterium]
MRPDSKKQQSISTRILSHEDHEAVKEILTRYWTDPEFLNELSDNFLNYVHHTKESIDQNYQFYVAEQCDEVVGVAGFRSAPEYLLIYAQTDNPIEFYILASKYTGRGIGEALRLKRIEEARRLGFSEVLLYSPKTHNESWGFHDRLGFERLGEVIDPDGEPGMAWRKRLM